MQASWEKDVPKKILRNISNALDFPGRPSPIIELFELFHQSERLSEGTEKVDKDIEVSFLSVFYIVIVS